MLSKKEILRVKSERTRAVANLRTKVFVNRIIVLPTIMFCSLNMNLYFQLITFLVFMSVIKKRKL